MGTNETIENKEKSIIEETAQEVKQPQGRPKLSPEEKAKRKKNRSMLY